MNKARIHHYWRQLQRINLWYVAGLFLVSCWMSVALLRRNNLHMLRLRDQVVIADERNGDVQKALTNLREYVTRHMNTNLKSRSQFATNEPPIQLVNQYNQAVKAAQQSVATSSGNAQLYADAEANCKTRKVPLTVIAQCIQDYVAARTTASNPQVAPVVPKELYTYDFVTPRWSPDAAGWSVLLSVVLGLFLGLRIVIDQAVSHLLKRHA